jgi:hypothetical protein
MTSFKVRIQNENTSENLVVPIIHRRFPSMEVFQDTHQKNLARNTEFRIQNS